MKREVPISAFLHDAGIDTERVHPGQISSCSYGRQKLRGR